MSIKHKGQKMKKAQTLLDSFKNWWSGSKEMVFDIKIKPKERKKRKYTKTSDYWKR